MDIRQLRYFVSIVEAGGFTAASQQLRIAQPSLSQHVIGLEKELGVKLLERQPRGIRLTDSGATFMEHALAVLRSLDRAQEAVAAKSDRITGRVAIGLPTTVAHVLAPSMLKAAAELLPAVFVHLIESHSGYLREWLEVERLDIAVLFNVTNAEGLDVTPLITEELQFISPGPASKRQKTISLKEVSKFDLVMASQSHDLRKTLESAMFSAVGCRPSIKAEVDSFHTVKQMVMVDYAHTVLPLSAVQQELAEGALNARRIVHPTIERHAATVSVSRRPKTPAQHAIDRLLHDVANRLIAEGRWSGKAIHPRPTKAIAG
jgi:LysR family transcriptional regulator, nitrogen assimilation regulatory protein